MGIEQTVIDEIVRRVLTVARPERIILFGSAAAGTMTPDSDIDLLVLAHAPLAPRAESVRIRRALRGMGRPFDIMVMDADWFEASKNVVGGLAHPAHKHGRVIYAQ